MKRLLTKFKLFLGLLLISGVCWGCRLPWLPTAPTLNPNLSLGNPSAAKLEDPSKFLLIDRPQYVLRFDRSLNRAAWASWQLNRDWLGQLERPVFMPDPLLTGAGISIGPSLYTGSGFDRGHLVPAADRNRTPQDSAAVFLMSNIVPQAPDNNRGPWEALESYCRRLVLSGRELYIVAGPAGIGGTGSKGEAEIIGGRQQIAVPAELWKIVVVSDQPGVLTLTAKTRVIAVILPNQQGIKEQSWRSFRTTVREIEARTGYNFLSNAPQDVQDAVETTLDRG
jgi:endonuclease G, mitochondrial